MPIMFVVIWFAILMAIAQGADLPVPDHVLPDHTLTPGAVTTLTATQLCAKGFRTGSERPPVDYTEELKKKQLKAYVDKNPAHYEEDHLISLEIGGHPSDHRNLWPEPYAGKCGARVKDKLEDKLKTLVCSGKLELAEAQGEIATDWVRAYNKFVGKLECK